MGSVEEDLDWSGSLLGGLTIMPIVSHSVSRGQPFAVSNVSLGYTDQDCGDHRFDAATPSPLHFDTHDFAPKDRATQTDRQLYGSLAIQGCSRRDRVLIASAGSTRFNDMLGSVYVVLSLYRGVPGGAGS